MEFQLTYFKSWKMMLWKYYTQYASKSGKLSRLSFLMTAGLEKCQLSFQPKETQCQSMFKLLQIALISHTSKVMLRILLARLQQNVNCEIPDVQAEFWKGRGTRFQIANIHWVIKKEKSSRKTSTFALLTMSKPLTVWVVINCGKFLKSWEYQATWPASW